MSKKLSTTKITGVPPVWSDDEFNLKLRVALHAYEHTRASAECISHPIEIEWLKLVVEKCNKGYAFRDHHSIEHDQLRNVIWMTKPIEVQAVEIEEIKRQVKNDYVAHLQTKLDEYKSKLAQQLVEAQEEKERRAAEQAKAKKLRDAQAEADACFGDLVIPEGYPVAQGAQFSMDVVDD
ncbi:hypothetical protein [Pseudomonas putida]|uniref:Uncharacterized protein n=1 Tax=Pseudomonas putida TaxID=303 RepID=A0A6I7EPG2_PSEPU|nr:hypothetical protein [Pseudomonas putida]QHW08374.1 hypothetical protein C2H86_28420 [Pseudomonas putida]